MYLHKTKIENNLWRAIPSGPPQNSHPDGNNSYSSFGMTRVLVHCRTLADVKTIKYYLYKIVKYTSAIVFLEYKKNIYCVLRANKWWIYKKIISRYKWYTLLLTLTLHLPDDRIQIGTDSIKQGCINVFACHWVYFASHAFYLLPKRNKPT